MGVAFEHFVATPRHSALEKETRYGDRVSVGFLIDNNGGFLITVSDDAGTHSIGKFSCWKADAIGECRHWGRFGKNVAVVPLCTLALCIIGSRAFQIRVNIHTYTLVRVLGRGFLLKRLKVCEALDFLAFPEPKTFNYPNHTPSKWTTKATELPHQNPTRRSLKP